MEWGPICGENTPDSSAVVWATGREEVEERGCRLQDRIALRWQGCNSHSINVVWMGCLVSESYLHFPIIESDLRCLTLGLLVLWQRRTNLQCRVTMMDAVTWQEAGFSFVISKKASPPPLRSRATENLWAWNEFESSSSSSEVKGVITTTDGERSEEVARPAN